MILGGFWRCLIFGVFWTGKKSAKNPEKSDIPAQKNEMTVFLGRPGGMRGATGEVRRGPNLSGFGKFEIGSSGIGKKIRHAAAFLTEGPADRLRAFRWAKVMWKWFVVLLRRVFF